MCHSRRGWRKVVFSVKCEAPEQSSRMLKRKEASRLPGPIPSLTNGLKVHSAHGGAPTRPASPARSCYQSRPGRQPPCTPNRARGHSTHTSAPDPRTEARVAQSHRARSLRTRPAHLAPWSSQAPDGELAVTDLGGSQAQVRPAGPGAQPWPETPAPSPGGHSEQRCRTSPSNTPPITRFALGSAHGDIPMSPT